MIQMDLINKKASYNELKLDEKESNREKQENLYYSMKPQGPFYVDRQLQKNLNENIKDI